MLRKTKKGHYQFEEFKKFKGLIHGFSAREFGDCNPVKADNRQNIEKFLITLGLERKNLVAMEQVHGGRIKVVRESDRDRVIPGVDGIITNRSGVVLGVKTADCLPILFYDPLKKIIGVAHAGWRGLLKRIPQKMIEVMIRLGSLPERVIIGVGPHIGGCCYTVDSHLTERFKKEFGRLEGMICKKKNGARLDLVIPVITQLVHTGILKRNITLSSACTSCQNQEFFSYRKDSKKTYWEMLGVISLV